MWFASVVFFVLWIVSLRLLLPAPVVYTFFTAMLVMIGVGVVERRAEKRE